jgi:hypothetical protein
LSKAAWGFMLLWLYLPSFRAPWQVYRGKICIGSLHYPEDAAYLVARSGGQVRFRHHHRVWYEGKEELSAKDNYDRAALIMRRRAEEFVDQIKLGVSRGAHQARLPP